MHSWDSSRGKVKLLGMFQKQQGDLEGSEGKAKVMRLGTQWVMRQIR